MKRILIATGIFPPDIGGPATFAKLMADHWGADASVLTYTPALRRVPKPFRQLIYIFKAWHLAGRADAVFALSTMGVGIAAVIASRRRKVPLIVRVVGDRAWEDAVNGKKTSLLLDDFQHEKKRGIRHKIQVWVCRKASVVIVPSRYLAGIVSGWGIDMKKIKIVANAVDASVLVSKEDARRQLGLQGNIIISIGRLVPWKGFRMLIKLMPQLLEINPYFRLVVVGDGPDKYMLQMMIKNLNLQGKVLLVGKKAHPDIATYLSAADMMILNSGYEGFSHQILEAMAAGVPVITSSVGGNRELVAQGENGFVVKYNDEFNLIEGVKTLWASPELRAKFSAEGKKTAAQFTPERTIKEIEAIIKPL